MIFFGNNLRLTHPRDPINLRQTVFVKIIIISRDAKVIFFTFYENVFRFLFFFTWFNYVEDVIDVREFFFEGFDGPVDHPDPPQTHIIFFKWEGFDGPVDHPGPSQTHIILFKWEGFDGSVDHPVHLRPT